MVCFWKQRKYVIIDILFFSSDRKIKTNNLWGFSHLFLCPTHPCIMDAFEINHETAYLAVLFVISMESLHFSAVVLKDDKPCNTIQEKSMTCNKYCSDVIGKCNKYCSDVIGKCNKYCSDVIGKSIKFNTFM